MSKKVVSWENLLLLLTVVLALVLVFSLGFLLHTQVPLAVVSSWSMEPTLHVGDIVVVAGAKSYSPGEIVVYESPSGLIVHRVVEVHSTEYITKGDANPYPDSIHPTQEMVKGKVVFVIPYIGNIKLFFEQLITH
ncbi:MAG: signal peptidase I [Infirmifilum sp.]